MSFENDFRYDVVWAVEQDARQLMRCQVRIWFAEAMLALAQSSWIDRDAPAEIRRAAAAETLANAVAQAEGLVQVIATSEKQILAYLQDMLGDW